MTGQISMGEREEREDSVRKCRGMFPSSRELQKSRRGGAVLSTSRDARLTVWSGSIDCIVIQHFVEVCHYQYVIPLPRYHWSLDTGLFSVFYIVVVILESPYTCELKIVTGLGKFLIYNFLRGRFTLLPSFRSLPHYALLLIAIYLH